ncbi:polysaccharide deacetylase family protein [Sedimentitalea sp. JM2-8]|uniref:Chitooligosaccharide deacetylase n=1 Tax=Sedimentitalea xiamensis TaxID=3050037 RepID=A0ABT7FHI5_9RHOB|nr:polysaccharide deacetylase family protein [Sedimentitalea xiamensis]MDK3074573.1 polysaccharide deacetylase family protein [Sedimentitalea xiamensis]
MRQVVLCLHGIGAPQRELEPGEAPYWISEELFHETVERVAAAAGKVDVRFTFDDGNASDVEIGGTALARAGHRAEMFLLTDRIDSPGSVGRAGIAELLRQGHCIGSHGAAHRDWTALSQDEVPREIRDPKRILAGITGQPVEAAAIPFGRYDRKVLARLVEGGFTRVYSSDGGPWRQGQRPVPRTSLTGTMTGEDIDRILHGPDPLARRLRRKAARAYKRLV